MNFIKKILQFKHALLLFGIFSAFFYLSLYFLQFTNICGFFYIRKQFCSGNFGWYLPLVALLCVLAVLYIFAVGTRSKNLKLILLFSFIFHIIMLFTWPSASTDIYNYINQGRLVTQYQANPYSQTYSEFPNDRLFPWLNNANSKFSSIYGPLLIYLSVSINWLAQNNFILLVLLFKLVFIAVNITNIYLVQSIFKHPRAVLLYAWNPLVLFEIAGNGHNDVLIIFFLLLSVKFIIKYQKTIYGCLMTGLFLLLAAQIKILTIFFLPLYYIFALYSLSRGKKLIFGLAAPFLCLLVAGVLYFPFWDGYNIASTLLVTNRVNIDYSGHSLFIQLLESIFYYLNFPGFSMLGVYISRVLFILIYGFIVFYLFKNRKELAPFHIINSFYFSFLAFILFALTWLMPWYLLILIFLAIILFAQTKQKKYLYSGYVFLFYAIIFYIFLR